MSGFRFRYSRIRNAKSGEQVCRFVHNVEGATAIEYALIVGLFSIVLATALPPVTNELVGVFNAIVAGFQAAGNG